MFSDYKFWAEMKDIVLAAAPEMELSVETPSFSTSGGSTLFTAIESNAEFKSSDEIKENIQISEGRGEEIAAPILKPSQDVRDLSNKLAPQRPDPADYSHLPRMLLKAIMESVSVAPNRDRFSVDIGATIPASKRKFAPVTPSSSTIITTTSPAKKAKKEDVIKDTAATILVTERELPVIAPTLTSTITTSPSTEMAKKEEDVIKDAIATIPTSKRKFAAVTPSTSTIIATTSPAKKAKKEDVIKDTAATILVTERELPVIAPTLTSTITTLPPAEKVKEEEDVIKDAATTIPATKRKPSTVTPDSTSITTTAPPPAKEAKKAKMVSQDEIRAALPAQGINFWELAKQFDIDVKDMAKAAKFEAKVKMWFRKENGTVLLS
jgi:hypothetical protein